MKTTLTKRALLSIATVAAAGALSASAMGMHGMMGNSVSPEEQATRQTQMFQEQATLIGASVDEVKTAWAEGKDFKTLASEKGITKDQLQIKMKASHDAHMKAQLQNLVTKGVITQAQADKRLATMAAQQTKKGSKGEGKRDGHNMKGMKGGMMGGLGF
jgi:hypothetical protein